MRQVAAAKKLDLVDCARLYALTAMAANDAFIAVFDAKYTYNLWRPVTAIRNADLTQQSGDAARGVMAAARHHPDASRISVRALHHRFSRFQRLCRTSSATRSAKSRSSVRPRPASPANGRACRTIATRFRNARIYAGFHYRFSTEAGKDMGKKIGELTVGTQMRGAVAAAQ